MSEGWLGFDRYGGHLLSANIPKLHVTVATGYNNLVQVCRGVQDVCGSKALIELNLTIKVWKNQSEMNSSRPHAG